MFSKIHVHLRCSFNIVQKSQVIEDVYSTSSVSRTNMSMDLGLWHHSERSSSPGFSISFPWSFISPKVKPLEVCLLVYNLMYICRETLTVWSYLDAVIICHHRYGPLPETKYLETPCIECIYNPMISHVSSQL